MLLCCANKLSVSVQIQEKGGNHVSLLNPFPVCQVRLRRVQLPRSHLSGHGGATYPTVKHQSGKLWDQGELSLKGTCQLEWTVGLWCRTISHYVLRTPRTETLTWWHLFHCHPLKMESYSNRRNYSVSIGTTCKTANSISPWWDSNSPRASHPPNTVMFSR